MQFPGCEKVKKDEKDVAHLRMTRHVLPQHYVAPCCIRLSGARIAWRGATMMQWAEKRDNLS